MSIRVLLLTVFAGVASVLANALPDVLRSDLFTKHMQKFALNYSGVEYDSRLQIFSANVADIELHNQNPKHNFKMGINQFTHLSYEEYEAYVDMGRPKEPLGDVAQALNERMPVHRAAHDHAERKRKLADGSFDWRTIPNGITPVKNQGQCGSCWTFAATGALEGAYMQMGGQQNSRELGESTMQSMPPLSSGGVTGVSAFYGFSEQNFLSCVGNSGCDGGHMINAYYYTWMMGGVPTENSYPYTNELSADPVNACSAATNTIFTDTLLDPVNPWINVEPWNIAALENAVMQQPVAVSIAASCPGFMGYTSGILDATSSCKLDIDHAVLLVGFGTDSTNNMDYWIIKNEWDTTWGQEGFAYIEKSAANVCGITTGPNYPNMKSTATVTNNHVLPAAPAAPTFSSTYNYAESMQNPTGCTLLSGSTNPCPEGSIPVSDSAFVESAQIYISTADITVTPPGGAATQSFPAVKLYKVPYAWAQPFDSLRGNSATSVATGAVVIQGTNFAADKSDFTLVMVSLLAVISSDSGSKELIFIISNIGSYAPTDLMTVYPTLSTREGFPPINANTIMALQNGFNGGQVLNTKFTNNDLPSGTIFSLSNINFGILPLSDVPTTAPTAAPIPKNSVAGTFVKQYFWGPNLGTNTAMVAACAAGSSGCTACDIQNVGAGVIEVQRNATTFGTCQYFGSSIQSYAVRSAAAIPVVNGPTLADFTITLYTDATCTTETGELRESVTLSQCAPAPAMGNNWWSYYTYVAGTSVPEPPSGMPGIQRYTDTSACESKDITKLAGFATYAPNSCIPGVGIPPQVFYSSTSCSNLGIDTKEFADNQCKDHTGGGAAGLESLIHFSTCRLDPISRTYFSTFGCPGVTLPPFTGAMAGTMTASIVQNSGSSATCDGSVSNPYVAEFMQPYGRCENNGDGTFQQITVNDALNQATATYYMDPLCATIDTSNPAETDSFAGPGGCGTSFFNLKAKITATPSNNGFPKQFSLDNSNNNVARAYVYGSSDSCESMDLSSVLYAIDASVGTCLTGMSNSGLTFDSMKVLCTSGNEATIQTFSDSNCQTSVSSESVSAIFPTQPIQGNSNPFSCPTLGSGMWVSIQCPASTPCDAGNYLSFGATCAPCPKGTYNPYRGFNKCLKCFTNSYAVGATACVQGEHAVFATGAIVGTEIVTFSSAQTSTCSNNQIEVSRTYGMCSYAGTSTSWSVSNTNEYSETTSISFLKETVVGTNIIGTYYSDAQCTQTTGVDASMNYVIPVPPTPCFNINTVVPPDTPNVPSLYFGGSIVQGSSMAPTTIRGNTFSAQIYSTQTACRDRDQTAAAARINLATGVCVTIPDILVQYLSLSSSGLPAQYTNKQSAIIDCSGEAFQVEMFSDQACQIGGEVTDLSVYFLLIGECMDLNEVASAVSAYADPSNANKRRLQNASGSSSSNSPFPMGYLAYSCSAGLVCPAGKYNSVGTCIACEAGKYNPTAGGTCMDCPGALVGQSSCLRCTVGGTTPNQSTGQCTACPANTYSNASTNWACTPCSNTDGTPPMKTFSPVQSGDCRPCFEGKSSANGVSCEECGINSYSSTQGATSCVPCPTGQITESIGATSCVGCPAGQYFDAANGGCDFCPLNTISATPNATSCTACATGQRSSEGATQCFTPATCAPGQELSPTNQCQACPIMSYSNAATKFICTPCFGGWIAQATGMSACTCSVTGIASDKPCILPANANTCLPGTQFVGGICTSCPQGTYSGFAATVCTPCLPGQSTPGINSVQSDCSTLGFCEAGQYWDSVNVVCQACPRNTYSASTGATSITACTKCPASTPLSPSGSSAPTSCTEIPSTGIVCGAGYYLIGSGSTGTCSPCPPDTFSIVSGASSIATCQACSSGQISTIGSAACTATAVVTVCKPGNYVSNGKCTPCSINTFSVSVNASICSACPTGQGAPSMATACTPMPPASCPPGTYHSNTPGSATGCALCPLGTWSATVDATSVQACLLCPFNTGSPAGSSSKNQCGTGGAVSCPIGTSSSGNGICNPCKPSTYGASVVLNSVAMPMCNSCPAATPISNTGAIGQSGCYAASANQTPPPTMAPVPAVDSFKLDMSISLMDPGMTPDKFNSNPSDIAAFTSAVQTSLFDPANPTNVYIITDIVAAVSQGRRLMATSRQLAGSQGISVNFKVSVMNASNIDPDLVNAKLAVTVNNGDFATNLNTIAAATPGADPSLQTSTAQDFNSTLNSPSVPPVPEQQSKAAAKSSAGTIIGAVGGCFIVLAISYYFYSKKKQNEIAAAAAANTVLDEKAEGVVVEMQNPIRRAANVISDEIPKSVQNV